MATLIAATLFVILMVAIIWVGDRFYARPGRFYEQLGTTAFGTPVGALPGGVVVRTIRQVGEKVPKSPAGLLLSRRFLIAAGYRSDAAVAVFYGVKVITAVGMFFLGLGLQPFLPHIAAMRFVVLGILIGAGYFGPNLVLERLVDRRQERLRLGLPDALDLMVVCVEAGLGLDQAINRVSQELAFTHPDICDEFGLVTLEMQAGKRRAEALRNLADRTGEDELKKLTAILIQTDRFGTSMADSLRTHSDFMRIRRRQIAEEKAGKIAVKLVFVIFFLMLPTTVLVVAGPSILRLVKDMGPMMRELRGGQ